MKFRRIALVGLLVATPIVSVETVFGADAVDFQQDILPLLSDRCFACHGPDASQRKADLRLDQEGDAKKQVVIPGKPDESELLKRIMATNPEDIMPPPESQKAPLTAEQVALFERWIAEGAPWKGHWAFEAPQASTPPPTNLTEWSRNYIDDYILARMEKAGLSPAGEASRETLIRRLTLDLTGLPPTPAAIDEFLLDNREDGYEILVDRLMDSPAFGEHLARTWLDGARYADTNGYQNDFHRVMWPWRDWVIGAFNENMPYDQFVVEQIAGDLLPNATESQRIATGFNRNNKSVTEGGSIEEEWLVENLVDRVETTSTLLLGLSMGCARCHDHKYDPITQRNFYEFYAFFNGSEDQGFYQEVRGNTGPQVYVPSFEQQQEMTRLDQVTAHARAIFDQAQAAVGSDVDGWLASLASLKTVVDDLHATVEAPLAGSLPERPDAAPVTVAPPVWTAGLLGEALALDGTANTTLDLGQSVTFEQAQAFTVSLWVRPDSEGALFSKMDEGQAHRGVDTFVTAGGELATHLIHRWEENAIKVVTDKVITMGAWTHIAVRYDGSSSAAGVSILVNGTAVPVRVEKDALSGPIDTTEPLRLGQRTNSLFLRGAVTDFRVYAQAVPDDRLRDQINQGLAQRLPETPDEAQIAALQTYVAQRNEIALRPQQEAVNNAQRARDEYNKNIPSVMVMQERAEPRPTYLLKRGAYDAPDTSEILQPGTPGFLPAMVDGAPRNRLGLAQWLVAPSNPLTARVAVNRFWTMLYGRGLVTTSEDFGLQGSPPSHPLLLDALAVGFMESGWDIKALLNVMVTSATYRQSSALTETLLAKDPENRFYARAPRYRLSAEMLRDNALAVSGLLTAQHGGPPAMPYQPAGLWEELAGGASQGPYVQGTGGDLYRRSIYTHRKRTVPHPTLSSFDAPSFEYCLARRSRTNTPLQALALLNDTTYVEAARHLGERMLTESSGEPAARLDYGFRVATGRHPVPSELATLVAGYTSVAEQYHADPAAAEALIANGESPATAGLSAEALAPYMTVAAVMLNLDETVTRE